MTIYYVKDDLFNTSHNIIGHGCNAQGVMGSGVAKQIRSKYPEAFEEYVKFVDFFGDEAALGEIVACTTNGKTILNMITQRFYGQDKFKYVSYDAIDNCFMNVAIHIPPDTPIAIPKIGAGLGGGNWDIIESIISHHMKNHQLYVYLG